MTGCGVCKMELEERKGIVPYLKFNWLEGQPKICERCLAAKLGISAEWGSRVKDLMELGLVKQS